jgi:signal transduction histidine kinase
MATSPSQAPPSDRADSDSAGAEGTRRRRQTWLRTLPFTQPVAAIVVLCGLLAVVAVAAIGVSQLAQQSDREASLRSRLLALSLVERLGATPLAEHPELIERAAMRAGAELLVVDDNGVIVADGSVVPPSPVGIVQLLRVGQGETLTSQGRVRFYAGRLPTPMDHLSLLTLVPAPDHPVLTDSLIELVGAYTLALLGIAALVAYALAKDAQLDIAFVRNRIEGMATLSNPSGTVIPARSLDQVGAMTEAFNELVQRYAEAEAAYKTDLDVAVTIERDKSAFLAALSHELKTPLNAILGFTDVLLADVEGPLSDEARENLEMVKRSGITLKALIRDILDLSALESGELTLAKSLIDVYQVAEDVCREHRVRADEKGLGLELVGEHAKAWADPLRVRQMIDNLVGNALKFTHKGKVSVLVESRDKETAVVVRDTGPGIASVEQTAIFDDYAQSGDSAARGAGSGLGLAITRRLVRMHDGSITLSSRLGEGATFTVLLPREPHGEANARKSMSDIFGTEERTK